MYRFGAIDDRGTPRRPWTVFALLALAVPAACDSKVVGHGDEKTPDASTGTGGTSPADGSSGTKGSSGAAGVAGGSAASGGVSGDAAAPPDASVGGAGGGSGSGAGGGTAGGGGQPNIGARCISSSECGGSAICLSDLSVSTAEGPAGGLCTMACQTDVDCPVGRCADIGMSSGQRYCVEECSLGNTPSKCHFRRELACAPVPPQGYACLPNCNSDGECASGLFCSPRTGLCSATPLTGARTLTFCTSSSSCRGICTSPTGKPGACFQRCTIGAQLSCIWEPGLNCSQPIIPQAGIGDLGICTRRCNCTVNCASDGVCGRVPTQFCLPASWGMGDGGC